MALNLAKKEFIEMKLKGFKYSFSEFFLIIFLILFILNFFVSLIKFFYYGIKVNDIISYLSQDVPGWASIDPNIHSFGVHYFGDYLLSNYWLNLSNPWLSEIPVSYPPFALSVFGFFDLFPYRIGLFVYLGTLFLLLISPFLIYVKIRKDFLSVIFLLAVGCLNAPLLINLDRANISGFASAFLFWSSYFALKNKKLFSSIFIGISVGIKIYPMFLLAFFLGDRRYKQFLYGVAASLIFFPLLFLFYPGNYFLTIRNFLSDLVFFTNPSTDSFNCRNVSFLAGIVGWIKYFEVFYLSNFITSNLIYFQLFILFFTLPLLFSKKLDAWLRLVISLSMTVTIPVWQYGYANSWAIAALVLILMSDTSLGEKLGLKINNKFAYLITGVTLVVVLIPWPYSMSEKITNCPTSIVPLLFSFLYSFILISCWFIHLKKLKREK